RGVAAVLVTSSSSVTTITAESSATVAVDRVPVADTVGAGDSFCGGVLTQLWERGVHTPGALATVALAEWRDSVAFAIRVASITVQRVGADPPRRNEL
ncbi:MAG: PfkB family carbohydrate kinase, partial [Actinomycetota bacterium]|nr:PfkB family carbohydrate kinase [Actinomycetota bacterium]